MKLSGSDIVRTYQAETPQNVTPVTYVFYEYY